MNMDKSLKFIGIMFISFVVAFAMFSLFVEGITDGCGQKQESGIPCVVRTPSILGCTTYDMVGPDNSLVVDDGFMEEVIAGTGIFNFTFQQTTFGVYTIILCDNFTTTNINIEVTIDQNLESHNNSLFDLVASLEEGIQNNATDIKLNITNTNYAERVWQFSGTIIDNILEQIINFLFGSITTDDGKTLNDSMSQIDTINETTFFIELLQGT